MSEKRFTMKYSFEDEEYVFYEDGIPLTPSQTVNNLNEQQDQVSKLQANVEYLIDSKKELIEKIGEQQAIIKSKDKQLERLYNYFQDYLKDEMSGNAFSEMWDFVKEDEKWEDE